jgi:hypothetical protein
MEKGQLLLRKLKNMLKTMTVNDSCRSIDNNEKTDDDIFMPQELDGYK